jgi:hypothetical protein
MGSGQPMMPPRGGARYPPSGMPVPGYPPGPPQGYPVGYPSRFLALPSLVDLDRHLRILPSPSLQLDVT